MKCHIKIQGRLIMLDVPNYWLNIELRGLRLPRLRWGRTLYRIEKRKGD
jgi:hypothetical protein